MHSESEKGEDPNRVEVIPFRIIPGTMEKRLREISDLVDKERLWVLVDADSLFGPSHLVSAISHAMRAIHRGENRARDPSIELLRWLVGARQVSEAIRLTAPPDDEGRALLVIISKSLMKDPCDPDTLKIDIVSWTRRSIKGLEPSEGSDDVWGGVKACTRLGIAAPLDERRAELAVLERVALCDL